MGAGWAGRAESEPGTPSCSPQEEGTRLACLGELLPGLGRLPPSFPKELCFLPEAVTGPAQEGLCTCCSLASGEKQVAGEPGPGPLM